MRVTDDSGTRNSRKRRLHLLQFVRDNAIADGAAVIVELETHDDPSCDLFVRRDGLV